MLERLVTLSNAVVTVLDGDKNTSHLKLPIRYTKGFGKRGSCSSGATDVILKLHVK